MTTTALLSPLLTITSEALPAWRSLSVALQGLEDTGREPVCASDPGLWFSKRAAERAEALEACGHCPVRLPCLRYAEAGVERNGIWGGRMFGREIQPGGVGGVESSSRRPRTTPGDPVHLPPGP